MVAFNVSLDDSSPLISYSGSWIDTPLGDSLAGNYSSASFHLANATGSSASFTFNGTGVWFYGAHRPEYGGYTLAVDGQTVANGSAASSVALFDQLLGGSMNLGMGEHTAVLSSAGPLDFDSLVFETQIGSQDGEQVNMTTIADSDSQISYSPPTAWQVAEQPYFTNGSLHFTGESGAQATLSFSGEAIAVYGGVNIDHGLYTVSLDGQTQQHNATGYDEYHPQTMLYFAQGLGAGNHNLTLTANSGFLDLDSVVVYSATEGKEITVTPSISGPVSPVPSAMNNGGTNGAEPSNNAPDRDTFHINQSSAQNNNAAGGAATGIKSVPPAVLAAIIAASIIGLVSIVLIGIFISQQVRKRHIREAAAEAAVHAESPTFIQDPDLENGQGGYFDKQVTSISQTRNARWTMKSFASSWSQASFAGHARDDDPPPPMPQLPAGLAPPVPALHRSASRSSAHSGSETLCSTDSRGSYDHKSAMMVEQERRRSSDSSDSGTGSVAPQRPARPPGGLDLRDLEQIEL